VSLLHKAKSDLTFKTKPRITATPIFTSPKDNVSIPASQSRLPVKKRQLVLGCVPGFLFLINTMHPSLSTIRRRNEILLSLPDLYPCPPASNHLTYFKTERPENLSDRCLTIVQEQEQRGELWVIQSMPLWDLASRRSPQARTGFP
jgi:hypothetical protein